MADVNTSKRIVILLGAVVEIVPDMAAVTVRGIVEHFSWKCGLLCAGLRRMRCFG
jgi:hypothetical protein